MATITLYSGKINQMPGLIKAAKQSVETFKSELSSLQKKASKVDSGVCNLSEVISAIQASTQTQENRIEALENFRTKSEDFINDTVRIDNKVAETVNQNKEDFYDKYDYLKPDCEKSGWEKFCDACEKVGEWCKEHWKLLVTVVLVIVAIVVIVVTWGAALGPIAGIFVAACKGLVMGALIGGISGGVNSVKNGGSFLDGFEDGAFSGAISGFLMGGAMAGLGQLGAALGPFVKCGSTIGNIVQFTAKVSNIITLGMGAFDTLAMVDNFTNIFGGNLYEFNAMLHESKAYNYFQIGMAGIAAFTGGMSSNMSCFVAGTLVLTACGLVAIENIKAGDKVISTDPETGRTEEKTVLETFRRTATELVHLTVNGEKITTTHNHPFYVVQKGFVNAGKLHLSDTLIDAQKNLLRIEDISFESTDEATIVYNFKVEDNHTYYVSKQCIFVHNADCVVHPDGEIEITDWDGYPEDGPKPDGKLKLIDGDEYSNARDLANKANRRYHRQNPNCKGMDIHEVKPVKFSGSPTNTSNKIPLTRSQHSQYTNFWNKIQSIAESKPPYSG